MTRKLSTLSLLAIAAAIMASTTARAQMMGGSFTLKAVLNAGNVDLSWTQPKNFSVDYYLVYRSEFNPRLMIPITFPDSVIDSTSATTYMDAAMPPSGMAFLYLVKAFDSTGKFVSSNIAIVYGSNSSGGMDHVTITSTPPTYASVDSLYQYQVTAVSSDSGAHLTYSLGEHPQQMAMDSTGMIDWMPQTRGWYEVEVLVNSSLGGHAMQEFVIRVSKYDATIAGTAVDSAGNPLSHVVIRLYQFMVPLPMGTGMMTMPFVPPFTYSAVTDSTGHYTITHVDEGKYFVHATPTNPNYLAGWYSDSGTVQDLRNASPIAVSSDSTYTANFVLRNRFSSLAKYVISGKVTDDSTGNPVKGAWVVFARVGFVLNQPMDTDPVAMDGSASFDFRDYFQNVSAQANVSHNFGIDHPGPFVFKTFVDSNGVYQDTLPAGHYILYAKAPNYYRTFYNEKQSLLTADVLNLLSDTTGIDFMLTPVPTVPLGSISGMVADSTTGNGVPARLIAFRDVWNHPDTLRMHVAGSYFADADSTGAYTFENLPSGYYKILAIPLGNFAPSFYSTSGPTVKWSQATDIPLDGSTVSGININVMPLPDSGSGYTSITGVVRNSRSSSTGVSGALVYATDANMNVVGYGITDATGGYSIAGLAPGTYNVFADAVGYTSSGTATSSPTYSADGSPTPSTTNLSLTPENPTAIDPKPIQPTGFALDQNYPNPFNPTTQIAFDIPQSMRVTITVFNILGQRIATLVDANMSAGSHVVTWNARGQNGDLLPTGVYFYRLSTPSFTAVKKMLLLK